MIPYKISRKGKTNEHRRALEGHLRHEEVVDRV
jgi:hypothetical protein